MARAFRNRDGSFGVEPEFPGDDITSFGACAGAIAQFHLDAAKCNGRLAQIARENRGTVLEQARAEIKAESNMADAKQWINRMSRSGKRRMEREHR